jgi:hypothetical protein
MTVRLGSEVTFLNVCFMAAQLELAVPKRSIELSVALRDASVNKPITY